MNDNFSGGKGHIRLILSVSVAIPVVVAVLLFVPLNLGTETWSWIRLLPAFHAVINSMTAVVLVVAFVMVKQKRIVAHRNLMTTALILGAIFLVSYVLYHASAGSTIFGDVDHDGTLSEAEQAAAGISRTVYVAVLLSHIGLSVVVVPLVLFAFYYALTGRIERHRKVVKFTLPIWLYVSVSGVLVYLMIRPYYI